MSAYTLVNVRDAEDLAAKRGMEGSIESRMLRGQLDSSELGVSYFRYAPGFRAPFGHHHHTQEEAYVVVSGSGRAKLGDDVVELGQWDVLRVAPEVIRAFEGGPDGLELIVVGGARPPEGDGEMVAGWWTD
jgi:mannose-6-phosphate isomerase-like protein (cupin superfamily)